jgi:hypothetical protein
MVIWTAMIDHGKTHISVCSRRMNDKPKAVSFDPEHALLLVPMMAFAHGRTSCFFGSVRRLAGQARVARSGCSKTSARANAAMQA